MSLPGEDLKNWIILPTIVSNEQESIDIVQMHRDIAEYAGKLKLPDVNMKQSKSRNRGTSSVFLIIDLLLVTSN